MPKWVIQCVEALVVRDGWYLSDVDELLFLDRFANEHDFSAALHEGGISGVAQDDNKKYGDNDDDDSNTDEYPDNLPEIARSIPQHPVEKLQE